MLDNKIVCCAATADAGAPLQKVMDDPKIGDTPGWPAFRLQASAVESPLQSTPIRAEQAIWSTVKRGKTARRALREVEFVAYISRRPIILGNGSDASVFGSTDAPVDGFALEPADFIILL